MAAVLALGWCALILFAQLDGSFSSGVVSGFIHSVSNEGMFPKLESAQMSVSKAFDKSRTSVVGTPANHLTLLLLAPIPTAITSLLLAGTAWLAVLFLTYQAAAHFSARRVHKWALLVLVGVASMVVLAPGVVGDPYMLGFIAVLGFVYFYYLEPSALSYVFLVTAIALNPAALILLLVLLADRRFRAAAIVVVSTLAAQFASILVIAFLLGRSNESVLRSALRVLRRSAADHGFRVGDLAGSYSLWTPLSRAGAYVVPGAHTVVAEAGYALIALSLLVLALLVLVRHRAAAPTALMICLVLTALLPFTSPQAAALLVAACIAVYLSLESRWRFDRLIGAVLASLLLPFDLIRLNWTTVELNVGAVSVGVGLGAILRPIILSFLLILLLLQVWLDRPRHASATDGAHHPKPLPLTPSIDTTNWISHRWLGLIVVLLVTGISQAVVYKRFLPLQEGWFTVFGEAILSGKVPYRDFYAFLPPVYLYLTAGLIKLFGHAFIVFRTWGIVERLLMTAALYLLIEKNFKARSATVATILGIAVFASNNSDVIYGYTQLTLFFVLLSAYLVLLASDARPKASAALSFAAGLLAGLAFVTKQSLGLITIVALAFALLVMFIRSKPGRAFASAASFVVGSMVLPALTAWLLWRQAALAAALDAIFGGASSKGSLGSVLFGFLGRTFTTADQLLFGIGLCVIAAGLLAGKKLRLPTRAEIDLAAGSRVQIAAVGVASIFGVLLPRLMSAQFRDFASALRIRPLVWQSTHWAFYYAVACSAVLVIYMFRPKSNAFARRLFVLGIVSLSCMYAYGLSFSLDLAATVPATSVLIASALVLLVRPMGRHGQKVFISLLLLLSMTVGVISIARYEEPYLWWGWTEPSIGGLYRPRNHGDLAGMQVSRNTARTWKTMANEIEELTPEGSTLFTYPHIPVFYSLAHRTPVTFGYVHYYDVMPDDVARADAARLKQNPPDAVLWLDLAAKEKIVNELSFRSGMPSGQRAIEQALRDLFISGGYVEVKRQSVSSLVEPGTLTLYVKKQYAPEKKRHTADKRSKRRKSKAQIRQDRISKYRLMRAG